METNSLKPQDFYSRNLCIKHRAASKRFNLLTSFDEKMKETNWDFMTVNFSSAENKLKHIMMVPSVAKWSFILLFCKPFSCSQLLSKVFIKTMNICICWHLGGNGSPSWVMWEEMKGGECKVKWMNRARRKTTKLAWGSVGNCYVRLSWTAICTSA